MKQALVPAASGSLSAANVDAPSVVTAVLFGLVTLCRGSAGNWQANLRALRRIVVSGPGQQGQKVALKIIDSVLRRGRPKAA